MRQEEKWVTVPKDLFTRKTVGKILDSYQEFSREYNIKDTNFPKVFNKEFTVPPKDPQAERKNVEEEARKAKFAQYRANSRFPVGLGKREKVVWPKEFMEKGANTKKKLKVEEKAVDDFTPKEDEIDFDELDKMLL